MLEKINKTKEIENEGVKGKGIMDEARGLNINCIFLDFSKALVVNGYKVLFLNLLGM